jgi:hypothetical protein
VGDALSQVFGVPAEFGQQIAQSAPIVIVGDLDPDQAQSVKDAMASVKEAGGNLSISAASSGSLGELNWPTPPTVGGRSLETYKPGYVAPPQPSAPTPAPPTAQTATPAPATSTPAPSGMALQCPHCSGIIKIQFSADAAAPPPINDSLPQPDLADVPVVQGQPVPARPPSGTTPRSGPMDLEDFEKGVGGGGAPPQPTGDDLLKQLDAALPTGDAGMGGLELAPPPADPPMSSSTAKLLRQKNPSPRGSRQGRRRRR